MTMAKPVSILVTGFGVSAIPLHQRLRCHRLFTACERRDIDGMSGTRGRRGGQLLRTSFKRQGWRTTMTATIEIIADIHATAAL